MKLTLDHYNGDRYIWKYLDPAIGVWFDFGPHFVSKQRAKQWMEEREIVE